MGTNFGYRTYRQTLLLITLLYLVVHGYHFTTPDLIHLLITVVGLQLIYFFEIVLPEGIGFHFDFLVYAIVLFAYGPLVLGWSALVGNLGYLLSNELRKRRKISLEYSLYRGAQFAISGICAGKIFQYLQGSRSLNLFDWSTYYPQLAALVTFYLVHAGLVYLGYSLDLHDQFSFKKYARYLSWDTGIYILSGFTALAIMHFYNEGTTLKKQLEFSLMVVFLISPLVSLNLGLRLYLQYHELHQLFEIIRLLNSPGKFSGSLQSVLDIASKIVSFDRCCIWETNPWDDSLSNLLILYPEGQLPLLDLVSEREGIRGKTLRSRTYNHLPDLRRVSHLSTMDPRIGSMVLIPLIHENDIVGLIDFYRSYPNFYDRRNLPTMQAIAHEVASSIAKNRMFRVIEQSAHMDKLTRLHNRHQFEERLLNEIKQSQRTGNMVSLLFIDIDHFKVCNDTYGHPAGDAILSQLADLLRKSVRVTDLVARYGGEEIVIILPNTPKEHAFKLAEKIRVSVSAHEFIHQTIKTHTTVSIGVATYPIDAGDPFELLKKADHAMYKAKKLGRNKVY